MGAAKPSKTPLHLRLTCEDWLETFKELNRAELGVLYYIRCLDPYGDRELILDSTEVSEKLGIHRTSVSRALKALNEKELISLEITKAKVSSKAKNRRATLLCMDAHQVHGRTSKSVDAQQESVDAQQESVDAQQESVDAQQESVDAQQTYIRIAHAQKTLSNLIQTESNSIQTPPLSPQGEVSESGEAVAVEVLNPEEEPPTTSSQEPINQSSSVASNENQSPDKNSGRRVATSKKKPKLTEQELQYFLDAYRAEKPSNFTNHQKLLDSHARALNKLVAEYGDRSLEIFTAALTWVREQDNDWWRKDTFSLTNLMSNNKMLEYADKHFDAMENNRAYCDRVEGRAISKDKGRDNGFQVFNQDGEQVTGASAQVKAAIATDPMLRFFLGAK